MLIPDLFLECTTTEYKDNSDRLLFLQNLCPIYTFTNYGESFYGKKISSTNIDIYYQKTIDNELISSFFYFNFTSDFRNEKELFNIFSLEEKVKKYLSEKHYGNNSNYTTAQDIFNELYSSNSLLIQFINFSNILKEVLKKNKNGTNICQYYMPWLFTFNCLGNIENILIPYNSFNTVKILYALEYADLFYLSNCENIIDSLLLSTEKYLENKDLINIIRKSNIFEIIKIALSVYNDILLEINYILTDKVYVKKPYQNTLNLFNCINLYYNYVKNEIFLIKESNSNIINFENDNILTQLEDLMKIYQI